VWLEKKAGRETAGLSCVAGAAAESLAEEQVERPVGEADGHSVHVTGTQHIPYDSLICKVYHCPSHVLQTRAGHGFTLVSEAPWHGGAAREWD
jgi:hypothetical protein